MPMFGDSPDPRAYCRGLVVRHHLLSLELGRTDPTKNSQISVQMRYENEESWTQTQRRRRWYDLLLYTLGAMRTRLGLIAGGWEFMLEDAFRFAKILGWLGTVLRLRRLDL